MFKAGDFVLLAGKVTNTMTMDDHKLVCIEFEDGTCLWFNEKLLIHMFDTYKKDVDDGK